MMYDTTNFHSHPIPSESKGDFVKTDTNTDTFLKKMNLLKEGNLKNVVFQTISTQWHQNSDYLSYSLFIEHFQL